MVKKKPNFEFIRKQVDLFLPDDMKAPIFKAIDICSKKIKVLENQCDTAYE